MGENVESENNKNMAKTSQLSSKNMSKTSQLSSKKSGKQSDNHLRKNLGKERGDTTVESTYTCPVCKEYSSSNFASVNAHSVKKHGKQLMLDDDDVVVASKSRGEKEASEQGKNKLTPYDEVKSADVFLRDFLNEFDFKEQFIDLLCRKVRRRNELPHPNDLSDEIQNMPSGITNPRSASYIAEEYSYDLADYLKQLESANKIRSSMGYAVGSSGSHNTGHDGFHQGISLNGYKRDNGPVRDFYRDGEKEKEKTSDDPYKEVLKEFRVRKVKRLGERMDAKEIADMERELDGGKEDEELKRLQEENRRLREGDGHRNDPNSEMRERIVKLEDDLRRRDEERMQRLEDDLKAARNTPPAQQNPGGLSREEAVQLINQSVDAQNKALTHDDLEKYVDRRMNDRSALTKGDLTYLEARDKLHLEEKKLDESGKTRDMIGTSIRDGFGKFGNIVSRMMTGEGEAGGAPVSGYSNQEGNMVQMPCPKDLGGCGAVMTAPINSQMITCIACGKRWEVNQLPAQQQEVIPEEKKMIQQSLEKTSEPTTAGGTSEPTTDASVEKIAENIAIGEGVEKVEEELRKKELDLQQRHEENERKREDALKKAEETIKEPPAEKKPWPKIDSNVCPICNKKKKSKRGVELHITEVHPEYKK